MKKIIVLFVLTTTLIFCSCNVNSTDTESDVSDLSSYEMEAIQYKEAFLKTDNDEDLKAMCECLCFTNTQKADFINMKIKYFPMFFLRIDEDQINNDHGFDKYYATYVAAILAAGEKIEFEESYNQYKQEANNIYYYASCVYGIIKKL